MPSSSSGQQFYKSHKNLRLLLRRIASFFLNFTNPGNLHFGAFLAMCSDHTRTNKTIRYAKTFTDTVQIGRRMEKSGFLMRHQLKCGQGRANRIAAAYQKYGFRIQTIYYKVYNVQYFN